MMSLFFLKNFDRIIRVTFYSASSCLNDSDTYFYAFPKTQIIIYLYCLFPLKINTKSKAPLFVKTFVLSDKYIDITTLVHTIV